MTYQIFNQGSSIRVLADQGELLLLKQSIHRISVVRDDIVEINTGHPLRNIFIRFRDVTIPQLTSALDLQNFINNLISGSIR